MKTRLQKKEKIKIKWNKSGTKKPHYNFNNKTNKTQMLIIKIEAGQWNLKKEITQKTFIVLKKYKK